MFARFKFRFVTVVAIFFCLCATVSAEELDPIAAQHLYTTKHTIIIPIEKLRPSEKITDEETSAEIRNIKNNPKSGPLDVIERGDGTYTIIDGNRIFAALKELGAKNFPAVVHPYVYQKDVKNIKDLYALNEAVEDEFNNLMRDLQAELGGELKKRPYIKKEDRVREKAKLEYNGDYSGITDMWAASLIYPDEESLLAAFDKIKNRDDVVWINDRWHNPLPQGYKDIQMCIILSNGAIAELQLHHAAILEVNNALDHYIYEFRRSNYKNSAMKAASARAFNLQKKLYASVWDGSFSEIDESTKKYLAKLTKQLSTEKSPRAAEILLDKIDRVLRNHLADEYNAAA